MCKNLLMLNVGFVSLTCPQEYWSAIIIFSIAGGIGTPISLDETTTNRSFGHFAKVLVELNLKSKLPNQILVERDGFAFFVPIEYESLPHFCNGCQTIGHTLANCIRDKVTEDISKPTTKKSHSKEKSKPVMAEDLCIDLVIEENEDLEGMERMEISPIVNNDPVVAQAANPVKIIGEIPLSEALDAMQNQSENFVVQETEFLTNQVATSDMRIVGKRWADEVEVQEEEDTEDSFTHVLSKSQKKKMRRKNSQEKVYFTRRDEPMITSNSVSQSFWKAMNLKLFTVNNKGNIWGLCNFGLSPSVIDTSSQHITISITLDNKHLHTSVIYGHTNHIHRRQLWSYLHNLMTNYPGSWCTLGDYNVVLGAHECKGKRPPSRISCDEFKIFVGNNNLLHLPTTGAKFTWSNKRMGVALTERRLDRALCNEEWLGIWTQVSCCTLPRIASDHFPLLLSSSSIIFSQLTPFRFHKMWVSHSYCKRLVSATWSKSVIGCPMFVLAQNLRMLKLELKGWNKNVFCNIHLRVSQAKLKVEEIQRCMELIEPDQDLLDQDTLAQNELLHALRVEEEFWHEKSRLNWPINGDRNTSFFHKVAKIRHTTKAISMLNVGDRILENQEDIANHVLSYFTYLFVSQNNTTPNGLINDVITSLVNEHDNYMLTALPSSSEIKNVVFLMNGDGAPDPDGFGGNSYHAFWDIVELDVCNSVGQFFKHGWILPNLNSNFVILIP
ncbi:PREDICTED: uncharacterized protein LOC109350586 [Lupinus angustifolius]|uniref:uncharacterized protein LOC109350586 n=1 Tax=Lupinus angustifolius TaxID=3871 RepID=UPI00092EFA27|nr:PREDICTED: uncharacterized protein LOC109350586 [Lupinus angustifolius]